MFKFNLTNQLNPLVFFPVSLCIASIIDMTVVSGQNRMVCVLCNLKPSKMRDIMSQAMVLAASSSDGSKVRRLSDLFIVHLVSFML